jgi:hypothetical protein
MQHSVPKRRNPFDMLAAAVSLGWRTIEDIPLQGEGEFLVLTISGLVRRARNRKDFRNARPADGYGPSRTTVVAVETGNYLGAVAWRWPDQQKSS